MSTPRNQDLREAQIKQALADYMQSEGCGCCENEDKHDDARRILAGLLNVPVNDDASGYDFNQFATEPTPDWETTQ